MKREKDRDKVLRRLLEIYEICSRRKWPFWFRWGSAVSGGWQKEKVKNGKN